MLKKMMLLAISAFALVAFAAPAVAQAQQLYTLNEEEEHVPLAEGAEVWATSTEFSVFFTDGGEWGFQAEATCEKIDMKGEALENSSLKSRMGYTELWDYWGCNHIFTGQQPVEFVLQGEEAGVMEGLKFVVDEACQVSGDPPLTYEHDANTLTIPETELELVGNYGEWCGNISHGPLFNEATFWASYTLTTPTGTPVYIE